QPDVHAPGAVQSMGLVEPFAAPARGGGVAGALARAGAGAGAGGGTALRRQPAKGGAGAAAASGGGWAALGRGGARRGQRQQGGDLSTDRRTGGSWKRCPVRVELFTGIAGRVRPTGGDDARPNQRGSPGGAVERRPGDGAGDGGFVGWVERSEAHHLARGGSQ